MVFDGERNSTYYRAMKAVVTSETTVMDLGAGLGVHGLNAAALGAAQVHLVDPSPVLEVAKQVAAANDFTNVQFYNCRVEDLKLEQLADVIVSVFTGNFLLAEDLLESLFYARDTFLKPGGTLIPDIARMEIVPVSAPDFYQRHIDDWGDYPSHALGYGAPPLDYQRARSFAANTVYYGAQDKFNANFLAAPAKLMEMDFTTAINADCDCSLASPITETATCHGWLGWFQMRLGEEWLCTSGRNNKTHWSLAFLPLERPVSVQKGESLQISLKRPQHGEWSWITRYQEHTQRQSTFLSEPVSTERVARASDRYVPQSGRLGEAVHWLLANMQGESTVLELASRVIESFPDVFSSRAEALKVVRSLVGRYDRSE